MTTWKRAVRLFLIVLSTVLVLVGAGALVVRSRSFHRYLLRVIIEHAAQASGGRVEIGDFGFRWSGLQADLYRIVVHGTEADTQAPLFSADHIAVGLKVISLRHQKVTLNSLAIDHPVIHFLVGAQGQSNLPQTSPRQSGSKPMDVFELAVRHFAVNNGAIYCNDKYTPLSADVQDLDAQAAFNMATVAYDGSLSYRQARVQFGNYDPLIHDLQARFSAAPAALTLSSVQIRSGSSWLKTQLHLYNYSSPSVAGSYQAQIWTKELAQLLKQSSLPLGEIDTQGTFNYQNATGRSAVERLGVAGKFASPALTVTVPQAHGTVRSFTGEYRLEKGGLEVRALNADALGGHVTGRLSITNLAQVPQIRVEGDIHDFSLAAARQALRFDALPGVGVAGRLNGSVQVSWRGSLRDLQVQSDATIAGSLENESAAGSGSHSMPVEGAIHLAYDAGHQAAVLHSTYLRTPQSALNLDGSLGDRSHLGIQAHSDDLREVDLLALILEGGAPVRSRFSVSQPRQLLGLAGLAAFHGNLTGTLTNPELKGQLSAANLEYSGVSIRSLRAEVSLSPSGVAFHQGELQGGAKGHAAFDVAVGLEDWSYSPRNPINVRVTADRVAVADIQDVADLHYPVSGTLSASFAVHGSVASPAGQGSIQLTEAHAWQEPIQNLTVKFDGEGNDTHSTVHLFTPAGSAGATLLYNWKTRDYDVQINFPAVHLQKIEFLSARTPDIIGLLAASVKGRGNLSAPQLEANVEAPRLQVRKQKLDGLKAQATVAQHQVTFALDSNLVGSAVHVRGSVNLTRDYQATVALDTQEIQLGPVFTSVLPEAPANLDGSMQIRAELKGPLKNPQQMEGNVEIPSLSLAYQALQLANASPIRLDYRNGILTLQRAGLKGTGTDLNLEATVPVQNPGSIRANATGTVDLHLLQLLYPTWNSSGQINLNVDVQGSISHPETRGVIRVADGRILPPNAPLGAEKVNGEIDIEKGRANIKSLSAEAGGGTLSASGSVSLQPKVQFDLAIAGKSLRLRYPQGTRSVLTSNLTLSGTPHSALLSGQVVIDRLSLTSGFDLATFSDQFSGQSSPAEPGGMAQNVKLNVSVASGQELALASSALNVQGSANLRVQGTLAEPVILGRATISSGEMFYQGNRYLVENGVIDFVNPLQTEPVVNLTVTTVIQQFNLTVNLVGPLDRLRTTYTSDPPLAPVDIINLLVTGQTTEASQTSAATPRTVLAQGVAGQVSSKVQKLTGITSLTIDPQVGGNQANRGAQVAVQQRVTKNLFFTFAIDVTTAQGAVIQVEYQITRRYSVSVVDQAAGFQFQIKGRKKF
ncbi:MAG TPA: translocation/assembly module TamB domain-containing protein [Terriglobia bacterium]|nr:translocation/assembly module TamB domain-containing protein [Terriglobia bacterium]